MSLRTRRVWLRPFMRRAILPIALAAPLFVARGQATIPLAMNLSRFQWVAPGRLRIDVANAGLQPELQPTIEGTAILYETSRGGSPTRSAPPSTEALFRSSLGEIAGSSSATCWPCVAGGGTGCSSWMDTRTLPT